MTEQELSNVRQALIEQYPPRKTFDDYTEYALVIITTACLTYFGAHVLAYWVG